jgi:uncharacterized protein DUF6941
MRAKILLADSAEIREGLLFLLGSGWTEAGPAPQPFAIAGLFEVDWEETNSRHVVDIVVEDEDGAPLNVPTPSGAQPLRVSANFEVGRPPGSAHGSSFNMPLAIPIMPVPWTPGHRYVVKITVDGTEVDRLRFTVRSSQPLQQR